MNKPLTTLIFLGILLFPSFSFASAVTPENILRLVNHERSLAGISDVAQDNALSEVASKRIQDMIQYNYWAHTNPVTNMRYRDFFPEIGENYAGPKYWYRGEILGRNFKTSESLVNGWMNSPTHKHAMLNGVYTKTGIAVSNGMVVQLFSN